MNITRKIAEFIYRAEFEHLPVESVAKAKLAFLDWLGVSLAGSRDPASQIMQKALADFSGRPQASLIGHNRRTDILSAALTLAGIEPDAKLTRNGEHPGPVDLTSFGTDNRFYGLCANADSGDFEPIYQTYPGLHLQLPAAGHLYDVRTGQYLGYDDAINCDLNPGDAHLWACMPYKVEGVEITGPETVRPGAPATFNLRIMSNNETIGLGLHVFRVELRDPADQVLKHYSANITAQNGVGSVTIPLAQNDPPGRWRIIARDVTTGEFTDHYFALNPE